MKMKMKIKISLLASVLIVLGLAGCSNDDGHYNVNNSWCAEEIVRTTTIEKITLSADVLFKFDSFTLLDMLPEGETKLKELVAHLSSNTNRIKKIKIVGYTDRIGSNSYNDKLGLERAKTIKDYLLNHNINADYIVESKGKRNPVSEGCDNLQGERLRSCLQPDRRVELLVESE